jgi:dipeptide/tripeptide permease
MKIFKTLLSFIKEIIISVILIVILVSFLQVSQLSMPMSVEFSLISFLIILFLAYTTTIWKELPRDEREEQHQLKAGRASFLVGAGVLVLGAVYQLSQHEVDPWLIISLIIMILVKVVSRIYYQLAD